MTVAQEHENLDHLLAEDTGSRDPKGFGNILLLSIAACWSLFQLWISSPVPFTVGFGIFNDTEARSIHLMFALFLAFIAFPARKKSAKDFIPASDYIFASIAAFTSGYIYFFYHQISDRPGAPNTVDIIIGCIGLVFLLEATRRTLGPPLMTIAIIFLIYCFLGPYMPNVIAHKGVSLSELINHQWITTEGVFGIALGVSTSFVFLFVLFGALLEQAGAGNYFIQSAFALFGHFKGGPGKAAVISSGLTGLISGSSIANVVTTGTFTIPMMKRVGFSSEKSGAIEVAASVNGQIMPPVMGAAAFLMIEYVGIPYIEVIKHAFLPALISYIALVYIVHLEAIKADMVTLPKNRTYPKFIKLLSGALFGFLTIASAGFLVYYGLGWLKPILGDGAMAVLSLVLFVTYLLLLKHSAKFPSLENELHKEMKSLPSVGPTIQAGFHYLLPVFVLIWCLMIERMSPGLSAFWGSVFLIFIVLTQRPLYSYFKKEKTWRQEFTASFVDLKNSLIFGARNMIGIGIATATAGIIVGAVSQTGVGSSIAQVVEIISQGNVVLMLALTAVLSLILGMGLPTTANYIVVSSLLAPVIVTLGASSGLFVPLIAVHLFVFYFGIMADVTPPVGLASFAAAAISRGDPIKTGIQAFVYSLRTAILPFLFIFNTRLLLINVTWIEGLLVFIVATIAILLFTSGTQGYFLCKNKKYESALLVLIAFTLFRPGFWMDQFISPYTELPGSEFSAVMNDTPSGEHLKIKVLQVNRNGVEKINTKLMKVPFADTLELKLNKIGMDVIAKGDTSIIDQVHYDSKASQIGLEFDQSIVKVLRPNPQPPVEIFYLPALFLLAFVFANQNKRLPADRRRRRRSTLNRRKNPRLESS